MGGSMIQLLAYGAQDVYLTGNPQVTFFQAVYKRNTNFAMEFYKNQINDTASNGTTLRITVTRYGDLVGQMFFELPLNTSILRNYTSNNSAPDLNWVAERAFSSIELQIGNNTIDKHYQTWWRLYSELFMDQSKKMQYAKLTTFLGQSSGAPIVYLPLNFFFNRNPGLFLPLVALQYHEIQLICTCASDYNTYFDNTRRPTLWVNYILLDSEERRRFAAKQHEYLIEQVQYSPDTVPPSGGRIRAKLQHPVKELIWCYPNLSGTNKLWDFTVYPNFVNLTCNPQTDVNINDAGTPKFASNSAPWVESGDILYNTNTRDTFASYATYNLAGTVYATSTPSYADSTAIANLRSNIEAGRIVPYNVTASSNAVTLTIVGNSFTVSNTFNLTNQQASNAAVITDFASKLRTTLSVIPSTSLAPYRWSNVNAYVARTNHLSQNGGLHEIAIQGIETSDRPNTFPMTLTFSGTGSDLLGFTGRTYGNTTPFASATPFPGANLFGFSNVTGITYGFSNVTAPSNPTFQYVYGVATVDNAIQAPIPAYPYTINTPTLIIDYINTNPSVYVQSSNILQTTTFTSAAQLASNLQASLQTILKTNIVKGPFYDYSNSTVSVDSSTFRFTVNGIYSNITTSPFSFDDASTVNPLPNSSVGPLNSMTLYFNGQERFVHDAKFLNQVQPFYHHTGVSYPGIYTYSFALKPEDHQPTGTCNFSRIDSVEFVPTMKTPPSGSSTLQNTSQVMFAVNYNVLRIKSGMAGVAFA